MKETLDGMGDSPSCCAIGGVASRGARLRLTDGVVPAGGAAADWLGEGEPPPPSLVGGRGVGAGLAAGLAAVVGRGAGVRPLASRLGVGGGGDMGCGACDSAFLMLSSSLTLARSSSSWSSPPTLRQPGRERLGLSPPSPHPSRSRAEAEAQGWCRWSSAEKWGGGGVRTPCLTVTGRCCGAAAGWRHRWPATPGPAVPRRSSRSAAIPDNLQPCPPPACPGDYHGQPLIVLTESATETAHLRLLAHEHGNHGLVEPGRDARCVEHPVEVVCQLPHQLAYRLALRVLRHGAALPGTAAAPSQSSAWPGRLGRGWQDASRHCLLRTPFPLPRSCAVCTSLLPQVPSHHHTRQTLPVEGAGSRFPAYVPGAKILTSPRAQSAHGMLMHVPNSTHIGSSGAMV